MGELAERYQWAYASTQTYLASLSALWEFSQTSAHRLLMEQVRLATQLELSVYEEQVFEMYLRLTSLEFPVDQTGVNECSCHERTVFSLMQAYSNPQQCH